MSTDYTDFPAPELETDDIRSTVVHAMKGFWHPAPGAEFDRWLVRHDDLIRAEALETFAEKWAEEDGIETLMFAKDDSDAVLLTEKALLARAAELRGKV